MSVRIFLSSTFLDMITERDALQRTVFPYLTLRHAPKEVLPIDLRWGIRDENVIQPRLIEYCLHSVERAAIFVGLIGQRYGLVLDDAHLQPVLIDRPYLKLGTSLTECEIRTAIACQKSESFPHSLIFGFRNENWTVSDDRARLLLPERFRNLAPREFADQVPELIDRQAQLKEFIRSQGCDVFEYSNADECASLLLERLDRMLANAEFPCPASTQSKTQNRAAQTALKKWSERHRGRLCLVGDNGVGKSQAIADYLGDSGEDKPLCLFADNFQTLDLALGWLESQLKNLSCECSNPMRSLRRRVFERLTVLGQTDRSTLIVDGLDKLSDWPDLSWLPASFQSVLILISNNSLWKSALADIGFTFSQFPALTTAECLAVAARLLAKYDKQEWPSVTKAITDGRVKNPQLLSTLVGGLHRESYETVDWTVNDFAQSTSLTKAIASSWGRLVQDLESASGPGAIRNILHFLSVDVRGLHRADFDRLLRSSVEGNVSLAHANLYPFLREEAEYIRFGSHAAFMAARLELNSTNLELGRTWQKFGDFFCEHNDIPLIRRWRAVVKLSERSGDSSYALKLLRIYSEELMRQCPQELDRFLCRLSEAQQLCILNEFKSVSPIDTCDIAARLGQLGFIHSLFNELPPLEARQVALRIAPTLIDEGLEVQARAFLLQHSQIALPEADFLVSLQFLCHLEINLSNWAQSQFLMRAIDERIATEKDSLSLSRCWTVLLKTRLQMPSAEQSLISRLQNLQHAFEQHCDYRGVCWSGLWLTQHAVSHSNLTMAKSQSQRAIDYTVYSGDVRHQRRACLSAARVLVHNDCNLDHAYQLLNRVAELDHSRKPSFHPLPEAELLRSSLERKIGIRGL